MLRQQVLEPDEQPAAKAAVARAAAARAVVSAAVTRGHTVAATPAPVTARARTVVAAARRLVVHAGPPGAATMRWKSVRKASTLKGPVRIRGEPPVGSEHENGAGVIDAVVAVDCRVDDHADSELFRDGFDARLVGGREADELGIEVRHVLRDLLRGIAFGVDRDEDHLRKHRRLGGAQALLHRGQSGERGRTQVRTIRIAEKQQRPVAA